MADFVKVSDVSQLSPGTMIAANVGGQSVLVVNVNGDIFAMSDECSHRGGLLSSGELYGTTVTCPLHGSEFDVRSGAVISGPAREPASAYTVRVVGSDVEVAPSEA